MAACFSSTDGNEKVQEFVERTAAWSHLERTLVMQTYLLGALRDTSVVGKYSSMHDNAIYSLGYSNPRTVKLAYKYVFPTVKNLDGDIEISFCRFAFYLARFCKVLDGAKTGLKIRPQTLRADEKHYNTTLGPAWKVKPKEKKEAANQANHTYLKRGQKNEFIRGAFIMDILSSASKQEYKRVRAEMDLMFKALPVDYVDPHLAQPWHDAERMAVQGSPELVRCKRRDLSKIAVHVHKMFEEHRSAINMSKDPGKGEIFSEKPIEVRQDILRSLSKRFAALPCLDDMETVMEHATISRLRASYAYIYDAQQKNKARGWSRFPWDVALRDLCQIKVSALGPYKPVTSGFYERFKMSKPHS